MQVSFAQIKQVFVGQCLTIVPIHRLNYGKPRLIRFRFDRRFYPV